MACSNCGVEMAINDDFCESCSKGVEAMDKHSDAKAESAVYDKPLYELTPDTTYKRPVNEKPQYGFMPTMTYERPKYEKPLYESMPTFILQKLERGKVQTEDRDRQSVDGIVVDEVELGQLESELGIDEGEICLVLADNESESLSTPLSSSSPQPSIHPSIPPIQPSTASSRNLSPPLTPHKLERPHNTSLREDFVEINKEAESNLPVNKSTVKEKITNVAISAVFVLIFVILFGSNTQHDIPSSNSANQGYVSTAPSTTSRYLPDESAIIIAGERYSTDLMELDLTDKNLWPVDLEPLRHMTNLTTLDLSHNNVSDLSIFREFESLTVLNLSHNWITNINELSILENLTVLDLSFNYISDVNPLGRLTGLEELNLAHNNLYFINPLENLENLRILNLGYNSITVINPVQGLSRLSYLNIIGNPIDDWPIREFIEMMPDCEIFA